MGWTRLGGVGIPYTGSLPVERNEGLEEVALDAGSAVIDWSGSRIRCRVIGLGAGHQLSHSVHPNSGGQV